MQLHSKVRLEDKAQLAQNPDSESARKAQEAERLRAAEKFMVVGTGEALCKGCGYEYSPPKGDPEYPVSPNTLFQARPLCFSRYEHDSSLGPDDKLVYCVSGRCQISTSMIRVI